MLIIVEGIIGAGKTFFADKLSNYFNSTLYKELAENSTASLLNNFYRNKKEYAFELQIHFLAKRMKDHYNATHNYYYNIMDRSIYGDRIFADLLHEEKNISESQIITYYKIYENVLSLLKFPTAIVFLRISPELALERIRERNRESEELITLDYLKRLNDRYEEWYKNYSLSKKIVYDKNLYDFKDEEVLNKLLKEIGEFI